MKTIAARFTIRTSGNWCGGYYAQIVRADDPLRVYQEVGPFHGPDYANPERVAREAAAEIADKHNLILERNET